MKDKMSWSQYFRYFIYEDTRLAMNYRVFSVPFGIAFLLVFIYNVRYYYWFFTN